MASANPCQRRASMPTLNRAATVVNGSAKSPSSLGARDGPGWARRRTCRDRSWWPAVRSPKPHQRRRRGGFRWVRGGLAAAGVAQITVAIAQISGVDFGMVAAGEHGVMTGAHLLNESTAWSLALGCGMIAAAIWPAAAPGLATVLGVFTAVLAGYVISDTWAGQVTAARVASHAPVIIGLVLVLLVYRERVRDRRSAHADQVRGEDIVLPAGASWGRRRGHVGPVDHSAA